MERAQYCLGKKPAGFDSRTLRFGAYLTSKLPAPPDAVNWGKNVRSTGLDKAPGGFALAQLKQDLTEIVKVPALRANISRRS